MTQGFDIDELERLLAAATPGEWRTYALAQGMQIWRRSNYIGETRDYTGDDAALIVAARNSLPAILTEIRELRAENARKTAALTRLRDCDWVISLPDRMDAVRDIARAALGEPQ